MVHDGHIDPFAEVFTTPEKATGWARQFYRDNYPDGVCRADLDDAGVGEHEPPPDDWLYHATYSLEGDAVWVVPVELDAGVGRRCSCLR